MKQERDLYEYIIVDGELTNKRTGDLLDTNEENIRGTKWIFVMSTSEKLYAAEVKDYFLFQSIIFFPSFLMHNYLICFMVSFLIRKRRVDFIIRAS